MLPILFPAGCWYFVYEIMASPQLENGYTRIANEVLEHLISFGLSGGELAMCLLVIRKTYGYGKKWDIISLSQLQRGLYKSHWYVSKLKKLLVSNRLLVITKNGISFNKNWEEWIVSNRLLVSNRATGSKQQNNFYRAKVVSSSLHTKETKENTQKKGVREEKKPYYDGYRLIKVGVVWRILTDDGWKDFAGEEKDIKWK